VESLFVGLQKGLLFQNCAKKNRKKAEGEKDKVVSVLRHSRTQAIAYNETNRAERGTSSGKIFPTSNSPRLQVREKFSPRPTPHVYKFVRNFPHKRFLKMMSFKSIDNLSITLLHSLKGSQPWQRFGYLSVSGNFAVLRNSTKVSHILTLYKALGQTKI